MGIQVSRYEEEIIAIVSGNCKELFVVLPEQIVGWMNEWRGISCKVIMFVHQQM